MEGTYQQSKISSTLRSVPLPFLEGMVMWSTLSLWMSSRGPSYPLSSLSSSILPMHTTSSKSSLTHSGIGVPQ